MKDEVYVNSMNNENELREISPDGPLGRGPLFFSTRVLMGNLLMFLRWLFRWPRCWGNAKKYRRADYRLKCTGCRRWMRYKPTVNTPAKRRPAPNAGRCVNCPVKWDREP